MTSATYDGNDLRATATTGSGTQAFVWKTTGQIPQIIMDTSNAYIYCGGLAPAEQVNLATGWSPTSSLIHSGPSAAPSAAAEASPALPVTTPGVTPKPVAA
jgi:hypothetical protein